MLKPDRDEKQSSPETVLVSEKRDHADEPMDEEEKVLAGRADANMPALLTRDVPGG